MIIQDVILSKYHAFECLKRLRDGAELTVQFESKKAFLNMFKNDEFEMNYNLAQLYSDLGFLNCTGGNLELKERHYLLIK